MPHAHRAGQETTAKAKVAGKNPMPALVGAMLVQFAAGGCVIPFITLLLRDRGLTLPQISTILSIASAALLVFPFLWGMLADRFVPLNRLFIGIHLLAATSLGLLFAQHTFWGMLVGVVGFNACFVPTLSLINALSFHHLAKPHEEFGRLRAWGSVGWILPFAPISVWLAVSDQGRLDFTLLFGMAACLSMTLLSFRLPSTPPGAVRPPSEAAQRLPYSKAVRALLGNADYVVLLVAVFLVAGSFSLLTFYSPPLLEDRGVPRPWIGPVQAIAVVFEIILFQFQATLIRRWNYTTIILLGSGALALRQLLYAVLSPVWVLVASYLLAGTVIVFFYMGVSLLVNALASIEVRATAQTLLSLVGQGMGPLFANWAAGRLTTSSGNDLRIVFLFAAVLGLVATALVAWRGRHLNRAGRTWEQGKSPAECR